MIRFGIIGAGAIAHAFSKACLDSHCPLQGIASRDIERAKAFQKQYGFREVYDNYESLYLDPLVDAIYVATPHGLHYEQMLAILKHKKHILCEKSFTLNAKQAKHIFEIAKAQHVFVMEAMWTRFLHLTRTVLSKVQQGVIGQITSLKVDFAFASQPSDASRLFNPSLGGGALLDVGIYPITYANLFLGKPEIIVSKAKLTSALVDGTIDLEYSYPNQKAYLHGSIIEEGGKDAYIYGELGYIKVPFFWGAHEAFIYDLNHQLIEHIHIPHKSNGYEYEIEAFIEAIENKTFRTPYMNVEDTLSILEQMDTIRKQVGVVYPNET